MSESADAASDEGTGRKVICGLGNPGQKFVGTRHNIGWEVLMQLRTRGGEPAVASKFEADLCEIRIGERPVLLAAPTTFMNLSGRSARKIVDFYKLEPDDLLVVCDDVNLDVGRLRLRGGGSSGGQNGLRNVCDALGTDQVPRLRVGVGRPADNLPLVNHVLTHFKVSERARMDEAVVDAAEVCELWVQQGLEKAQAVANAPG